MPLSNGGGTRNGRPPLHPDRHDKLKQVMPGGTGLPRPLLFLITVAIAAIIAFYAFTFSVDPDELGVVMLFGKPVRTEPPGLHFRLPYPWQSRVRAGVTASTNAPKMNNQTRTMSGTELPLC